MSVSTDKLEAAWEDASEKTPVQLLTTTGRKSHLQRATPLLFVEYSGNIVIVASFRGRDENPALHLNLKQNPVARIRIKGETRTVKATVASGSEKARLWPLVTTA